MAPQVANPDAPAPNGHTPLQLATNNNHIEIVEFLQGGKVARNFCQKKTKKTRRKQKEGTIGH